MMRILVLCLLAFVVAAALAAPYPCTYTSPSTNNKVREWFVPRPAAWAWTCEYSHRAIDRVDQYDLSNMWRDGSKGQKDYSAVFNADGSTFYVYATSTSCVVDALARLHVDLHRLTRFGVGARAGTSVARQSSPTAKLQMVCAKSRQLLATAMAMPPSSFSPIIVRLSFVCVCARSTFGTDCSRSRLTISLDSTLLRSCDRQPAARMACRSRTHPAAVLLAQGTPSARAC